LNGIAKICEQNGIDARNITHVMHGTTVATNTVLEGKGARVGLVTTKGYRHVLQMARSFVPGGLGGWVTYNKRPLMAPLELTIEADERMDAQGVVVKPLDEANLRKNLERLKEKKIEALTVCLVNSYANGENEVRVRAIAESVLPGVSISISSEVMPEMYEYERAETTVVNSYIRPVVSRYMENLHRELGTKMKGIKLQVLRSDGGLASVEAASNSPVNMLMSGPAGGVSGALWVAKHAGYKNLLTFDMGGTSTDVALIKGGVAQTRRETRVSDVTVRVPSIDVRTVGAGGGSIAYVPELTKALRVGPQSAGAVPGPAAYMKGGTKPTVTDANVVLGYLPISSKLGGDMKIDKSLAEKSMATIAQPLGKSIKEAAEGVVNIVNENMFGALRLVSIEQGYDPRDFALIAFGGAGPLHANALGKLMGSWPVIIPPAPGVLCAYGDATTRLRDEASRTFIRRLSDTSNEDVLAMLDELTNVASRSLAQEGLSESAQTVSYQIDLRYRGQGMSLTIAVDREQFMKEGLLGIAKRFDEMHTQLYTFALEVPQELVNLRAVVEGPETLVKLEPLQQGTGDSSAAVIEETELFFEGQERRAKIYDRAKLRYGDVIPGPAIVCQMDSTTVILPDHTGVVDAVANIIIRPNHQLQKTQ
jgi:N-methylhydantoinase A